MNTRVSHRSTNAERSSSERGTIFTPFLIANLALLAIALLAGGASRPNDLVTLGVELLSLAMLPWAVYRIAARHWRRELVWPLLVTAGVVLVPIIQLVPLPPGVWTALPDGEQLKSVYAAVGEPLPWRALSLTPDFTLRSGMALATPIVVFLSWFSLSNEQRRLGTAVILTVAAASLFIGTVQITTSRGYLYRITNLGSVVGFFSNRNHEASLLVCTLPLTAGLLAGTRHRVRRSTLSILALGLLLTVIVALAAARSRAGLLLLPPALLASFMIIIAAEGLGRVNRLALVLGAVVACAFGLAAWFGIGPVLARFQDGFGDDIRFGALPLILRAGQEHLPFGSGLGSFDTIYRSVEQLNTVQSTYLNHAHDDYLELFLEAGLLALGLIAAFIVWWARWSIKAWFAPRGPNAALPMAVSVVVGLLLVHSFFDYPLRTLALSSVFAYACACLLPRERRR